jgi:pimeloyl-ACP methyl ester carboxylesterase
MTSLHHVRFSYGTILGSTFAAMRPDLVKRMVLDGVSNAESYFNDPLQWGRDGMAETHKVCHVCRRSALIDTNNEPRHLPDSCQHARRLAQNTAILPFLQASPARPKLLRVFANV